MNHTNSSCFITLSLVSGPPCVSDRWWGAFVSLYKSATGEAGDAVMPFPKGKPEIQLMAFLQYYQSHAPPRLVPIVYMPSVQW